MNSLMNTGQTMLGHSHIAMGSPIGHSEAVSSLIEPLGITIRYEPNVEIYEQEEPTEYCYMVLRGAVCGYKLLTNGRRQISALYLRGDFFGLEPGNTHNYSAQAIAESKLLVVKRSAVVRLAERDHELSRRLWMMTCDELHRARARVLLLMKNAKGRVATFLLEMSERTPKSTSIELPMSRQDIADYLGLTIETVSRELWALEKEGTITLPNVRQVIFRNREALLRYSD